MNIEKEIIAFKGFDEDFKCRGFQYEIGKTYIHAGHVSACNSGFHSCSNPFDVLNYYNITSRFATVVVGGELSYHDGDSKIASGEITIKEELKLPEFISSCIKYLVDICCDNDGSNGNHAKIVSSGNSANIGSSGNSSKIVSSGEYANIVSSGNSAHIGSSGDSAQIGYSGNFAQIGSSGNSAHIGSSGDSAQIGSSGNHAQIGSSGEYAKIGSSGNHAQIGSSGNHAKIGSNGNFVQIGSSGNFAQIGSSGNFAQIGSSGDSAKISSSGDYAQIGSSGDFVQIGSSGESSIITNCGVNTKAKGGKNCAMALSRWVDSEKRYRITVAYVGENGIKEDTWYKLDDDGNFVEAYCKK